MRIKNAEIFQNGRFSSGGLEFGEKIISFSNDADAELDAQGMYLIPGLVDIHTHGAMNEDASDGSAEGLVKMSRYYAYGGVTAWCPTTMTIPVDEIETALRTIAAFERPVDGARLAGINLEGPFLSMAKRGAQAASSIKTPDIELFKKFYALSCGKIRLMTLAAESVGGIEFASEVSKLCTVSLGHTTADYDTAMRAYSAGASHATHLYNGMPALAHREPGVIGAARDSGATVELICDGLHIHPSVIRATFAMFPGRVALISDSLRCAGMPDGDYMLGGQPITMSSGKAVLKGTTTLAGSSIHLMEGLRRAVSFGIPLEDAVSAVTEIPARAIRMDNELGRLEAGRNADFVLLDKELNVNAVFIGGQKIK